MFARLSQHRRDKDWCIILLILFYLIDTRDKLLMLKQKLSRKRTQCIHCYEQWHTFNLVRFRSCKIRGRIINPTMSDDFVTKYNELKEMIMHLSLEKIESN